jgi:hypothetical protein
MESGNIDARYFGDLSPKLVRGNSYLGLDKLAFTVQPISRVT